MLSHPAEAARGSRGVHSRHLYKGDKWRTPAGTSSFRRGSGDVEAKIALAEGGLAALVGADANDLVEGDDENFSVADLPRVGRFLDRIDCALKLGSGNDDLDA